MTVTAGQQYWIAILGPTGTGTPQLRDATCCGRSETHAVNGLSALPATWIPGALSANSPASAYAAGALDVTGSVTPTNTPQPVIVLSDVPARPANECRLE